MIIIRKINFLLIFILFFTFTFSFSCARKSPPIATVGGEPIAKADLDQAMEEFGKEVPLPSKPEELEILKKDLLDQLIQDRIFLQAARKEKIALPDSESEEAIKKAKADYSDQEFSEMLKTKGLSYDRWVQRTRDNLQIQKLEAKVTSGLPDPTPEEINGYYGAHIEDYRLKEGVRIRQILLADQKEADAVRKRIQEGADFARLAREKSISVIDRENGGDLGVMTPEEMPEGFEITLKLPVGAVSKVVKSPYGFHIFKVEERRKAKTITLSEEAQKIKTLLAQEKRDRQFARWARDLRARTEIKINPDLLKHPGIK